jgi:hypothetical protein
MRRRLALAAAALVGVAALTGCTGEELNRWGARLRGAPVTDSYRGYPYFVTGPASPGLTYENCVYAGQLDPGVPDYLAPLLCSVNREWMEGQHGYAG